MPATNSETKSAFDRAKLAVALTFIINGFSVGTFISRIPDFKALLDISNSTLGNSLFFASFGVLVAIPFAGRQSALKGSSPIVFRSTLGLAAAMPIVGACINLPLMWVALFLYGFAQSCQDLSMNAHAVTLEQRSDKRVMSTFHAMWSLGALGGGAIGGVIAQLGASPLVHATGVGIASALAGLLIKPMFLPASEDIHEYLHEKRAKRPRIFWILGLLGLCGAIAEGSAGDWGGILARDTFHASPFVSTLPYVLFASTMVMGRLSGDRLAHRYGVRRLLMYSGFLAGIGLTLGLLMNNIAGEIFGWLLLGAGISVVIPLVISSAGTIATKEFPGVIAPAESVGMVSGISYFGFVFGPPTMGFLSDHITLRGAMFVPALLAITFAIGAHLTIKE